MPDLIQLKRGPSSNLHKANLKQGEPAYLYDTKKFCIGTTENTEPITFINEQDVKDIARNLESKLQENINVNTVKIGNLDSVANGLSDQIQTTNTTVSNNYNALDTKIDQQREYVDTELAKKMEIGKIKSSDLSTAYDAHKIGLANLRQEVISYIQTHGGGGGSGDGDSTILPSSIGFDLLAVEVVEAIQDNDFGTFAAPKSVLESSLLQTEPFAIFPNSIGFDLLAIEVVEAIRNNDHGAY